MDKLVNEKLGDESGQQVTDIEMQNLECSSLALKDLLNLTLRRVMKEDGLLSLAIK